MSVGLWLVMNSCCDYLGFSLGSHVAICANVCTYVAAFETWALLFENYACVWHACSQMEAGAIEPGTGAEFAFQRLGPVGYSL